MLSVSDLLILWSSKSCYVASNEALNIAIATRFFNVIEKLIYNLCFLVPEVIVVSYDIFIIHYIFKQPHCIQIICKTRNAKPFHCSFFNQLEPSFVCVPKASWHDFSFMCCVYICVITINIYWGPSEMNLLYIYNNAKRMWDLSV